MYDTLTDPQELDNLAVPGRRLSKGQQKELNRMIAKIKAVQRTQLHSLPGTMRLLNISGLACNLQSNYVETYFGSSMGQPFGNGTFTVTKGPAGALALQIVAQMGSVEGLLLVEANTTANATTTLTGSVLLTKGHGYFHDVKAVSLPFTFVLPPPAAMCDLVPMEIFCHYPENCPGTFVMGGMAPY